MIAKDEDDFVPEAGALSLRSLACCSSQVLLYAVTRETVANI